MLALLLLGVLLALLAPAAQAQKPAVTPSAPPASPAPAVFAPAVPFPGSAAPAPLAAPYRQLMPGVGAGQGAGKALKAADGGHNLVFTATVGDVRVDLAFRNTPVRDALRQVLEQAKQEWALERDVPADCRVTLCAARVRLSTALDALTEAAGVGWSAQPRYDAAERTIRTLIRVGGSPSPAVLLDGFGPLGASGGISLGQLSGMGYYGPGTAGVVTPPFPSVPAAPNVGSIPAAPAAPLGLPGDRITFTCRHCHAQISTIRPRVQPLCPHCGRRFHADWQFCPHDGTKRPPAPGEWRFCPVCGKPVESDHADAGNTTDPDADHPAEQIERTGQVRPDASPFKSDWNDGGE